MSGIGDDWMDSGESVVEFVGYRRGRRRRRRRRSAETQRPPKAAPPRTPTDGGPEAPSTVFRAAPSAQEAVHRRMEPLHRSRLTGARMDRACGRPHSADLVHAFFGPLTLTMWAAKRPQRRTTRLRIAERCSTERARHRRPPRRTPRLRPQQECGAVGLVRGAPLIIRGRDRQPPVPPTRGARCAPAGIQASPAQATPPLRGRHSPACRGRELLAQALQLPVVLSDALGHWHL